MIAQTTIDKVRALSNTAVIGSYIKLDALKQGKAEALCPFHEDKKKGSFYVFEIGNKGAYHCFACGAHGQDHIRFVMDHKRLGFVEAVEEIAGQNGIEVVLDSHYKSLTPEQLAEKKEERKSGLALLAKSQAYFVEQLAKHPEIVSYWNSRGFSRETTAAFGVGYQPDQMIFTPSKQPLDFQKIGLVAESGEGKKYDPMRHRITFPLHNANGEIIGFAGRAMGDRKPKYINPTETAFYNKGTYLYGLYQSAKLIKEQKRVFLVEGYPNVLRLFEVGLPAVATGGTALTDGQMSTLKRYTDKVIICRDADAAGEKATDRDIQLLLKNGFDVAVFDWPDWGSKFDVDELFAMAKGYNKGDATANVLAEFEQQIRHWDNFLLQIIPDDIAAKRALTEHLITLVRSISDPIGQEFYTQRINTQLKGFKKMLAATNRRDDGDDDDFSRVRITEQGTFVVNEKGNFTRVADFQINLLYQLSARAKDTCKWIVELKRDDEVHFIIMPDESLHNVKKFRTQLFAERYPVQISEKQLSYLLDHLLPKCKRAEENSVIGWHEHAQLFFFANGAYCPDTKQMLFPNHLHMVEKNGIGYSMPYADVDRARLHGYEEYLRFSWQESPLTLKQIADFLAKSWGEQAYIGLCFVLATLYSDIVSIQANKAQSFFPILYMKGYAGSGKSTFANLLANFFGHQPSSITLGNTTAAAIPRRMAKFSNTCLHLEDYGSNREELPKITAALNSMWERKGREISDKDNPDETKTYPVNSSVVVTSNILPQDPDNRLQTRVVYLLLNTTSRSDAERREFESTLNELMSQSWTKVTTNLLAHRAVVEENFLEQYRVTASLLKQATKEISVPDRVLNDYAQILSVAAILVNDCKIDLGISTANLLKIAIQCVRAQIANLQEQDPLTKFFQMLQVGYDKYVQAKNATMYCDDHGFAQYKEPSFNPAYFVPGIHFRVDSTHTSRNGFKPLINERVLKLRLSVVYDFYYRQCQSLRTDPLTDRELWALLKQHRSYDHTPIQLSTGKTVEASFVASMKMKSQNDDDLNDSGVGQGFVLKYNDLETDFGISFD